MNFKEQNECYLDQIRLKHGAKKCISVFRKICEIDRKKALALLNHKEMTYATLYLLLEHIRLKSLYAHLNQQNISALLVTNQIIAKDPLKNRINYLAEPDESMQKVLLWILTTGCIELEPDDDYRHVIDIVASVCINTCHDHSILPLIASTIFQRHTQGQNIHTLTWVFFNAKDVNALHLIAPYLASPRVSERNLACRLLKLEPTDTRAHPAPCQNSQHKDYITWLSEQQEHLTFTDQHMQQHSRPCFCHACGWAHISASTQDTHQTESSSENLSPMSKQAEERK